MYEIEATVTLLTPNELKLTANWPLRWLQASGSIEVQRKLEPEETLPTVEGLTEHSEVGVYQRSWPNLAVGDRMLVQCFLQGESRQGSTLTLPITNGPVRFAVGPPNGIASNSWRCWVEKKGDIYIICRDNFQDCKVSLHTSGRWHMKWENRVLAKYPGIIPVNRDLAWDRWNEPPAQLPGTVIAFRLVFPTSELAVSSEQRAAKDWKRVIFIEAAPAGTGKMTVITLFVTTGDVSLQHESEPFLCLASLDIGKGRRAQLIAHGEPEAEMPEVINESVRRARAQSEAAGIKVPPEAYGYFLGTSPQGWRFIFGARLNR